MDGYSSHYGQFALYELTKASSTFVGISVTPEIEARPGQVQMAGRYLTVEGTGATKGASVYRLAVSGSAAKVVGVSMFKAIQKSAAQSWIYGKLAFIPYGTPGNGPYKTHVGAWKYPRGGKPLQKFSKIEGNPDFQAVTFSPSSQSRIFFIH